MHVIEGGFATPRGRIALVAARFNSHIVDALVEGAHDMLLRHGVSDDAIDLVRVPGAFELAPVAARLVAERKHAAVIALGCVIRGATAHFDYVAGAAANGIAHAAADGSVPVVFGVLTTETIEQAVERAGTKAGNKGADAALAAIELVDLYARLGNAGA